MKGGDRMKERNKREFVRLLFNNGFRFKRMTGKHEVYERAKNEKIAIPKGDVNFMIQHRLIKGFKLKEV